MISTDIPVVCSYEDIACALITAGCDTTVEDDCSRNGLYHAVKRKRELIIHALLDRREPYSLRRQCRTVIRQAVTKLSPSCHKAVTFATSGAT